MAGLEMHEAAVVKHLDQIQRPGFGQQRHRLVVLPQRLVVAAAALEQQGALGEQDRPLRVRDVLLSLRLAARHRPRVAAPATGRFRAGRRQRRTGPPRPACP